MSTTEATYRKTRNGEWVVFGPIALVKADADVTVMRRNGSAKVEHVASVGKAFIADGTKCCYGYIAKDERSARPATRSTSYRSSGHGRHTCHIPGRVCDECA